ncbi:MAG: hypothetical protein HN929_02065 [Chloroflexi bacterium]|jgi:hypothetical protein|nr:hypothetical protein [Chloroflexota bacterium]MBT7080246.1 hypothetical protein [Chloroflexota bacterium]MBT7289326.1 hypothetical protein [Chloroflexota bacterium]
MDQQFRDVVDALWERIMVVMDGDDGEACAGHLRTACQKCLFAEERFKSLSHHVIEYKKQLDRREILDSLHLAMDYEHLLISLRNSIDNLSELIGCVLVLEKTDGLLVQHDNVGLREIVAFMKASDDLQKNSFLYKLMFYLNKQLNQGWYKDLMDPAVIISHDRFGQYPRVSARSIDRQLLDFTFILRDTTGDGSVGGHIIPYCSGLIDNIKNALKDSFVLIDDYLAHQS